MDETSAELRKEFAQNIAIEGCKDGLGIRIVGGRNIMTGSEQDFGIFIKEIISNSLADRDGRLEKGDQILEANGTTLMGVSNEKAVDILKSCTASDRMSLMISRDAKSKSDFRRLSNSLQQQLAFKPSPASHTMTTLPAATVPNGSVPQLITPVATSTPRVAEPGEADLAGGLRESVASVADQRSSSSSELTRISTTDVSSHADESDHTPVRVTAPGYRRHAALETASQKSEKSVDLSDVVVAVGSTTLLEPAATTHLILNGSLHTPSGSDGDDHPPPVPLSLPPPIPSSPPPDHDMEEDHSTLISPKKPVPSPAEIAMASAGSAVVDAIMRSRSSPEGKSVSSPPPSVGPPASPTLHTATITKTTGLGVIIAGGHNRSDGPHIYVEKILDGMDAAKDGRLQKGDRILDVNGESFINLTRERALTILTQLKIRRNVKSYMISFERPASPSVDDTPFGPSPPLTLSTPTRTTTTSIFDSSTLPVGDVKTNTPEAPGKMDVPEVYYRHPGREPKPTLTLQDIAWLKETGEVSKMAAGTPSRYMVKKDPGYDKSKYDSLHKRLSLDPNARVKLSKLEWALSYMGYILTPEQKQRFHSALDINEEGRVVFAEFVKLAQEMFQFQLDDSHLEANLVMALTQKEGLELPAIPQTATSIDQLWKEYSPLTSQHKLTSSRSSSQPSIPHSDILHGPVKTEAELEHMRRHLHSLGQQRDQERITGADSEVEKQRVEKERALQENARLKVLLNQKEREYRELELQLKVAPGSSEETQVLRKRLRLAEAAGRASREKELQKEETIRCMEAELSVLRGQERDLTTAELRRRLATLNCQMKKEQAIVRRYQVATEKLLHFAENCHEALVKSPGADKIMYHVHGKGASVQRGDVVTGNPRPPSYLSRHAKVSATTLAEEAKETITAVRKILQTDTLPFGWEEVYTEDGHKYYVNHESQSTSWVHPVTKVSATPPSSRSSTPASRSRTSSHSSHASTTSPQPVNQPA